VKRFRGGLVFKAHRLVYHLGWRAIKKRSRLRVEGLTTLPPPHTGSACVTFSPSLTCLRGCCFGFGVWGLGFGVWGLAFRESGKIGQGFEVEVLGLVFGVLASGLGLGFDNRDSGSRVRGWPRAFGLRVCFVWDWMWMVWVSGFGLLELLELYRTSRVRG